MEKACPLMRRDFRKVSIMACALPCYRYDTIHYEFCAEFQALTLSITTFLCLFYHIFSLWSSARINVNKVLTSEGLGMLTLYTEP